MRNFSIFLFVFALACNDLYACGWGCGYNPYIGNSCRVHYYNSCNNRNYTPQQVFTPKPIHQTPVKMEPIKPRKEMPSFNQESF